MLDRSLRVKFAAVLVVMSLVPIGVLTVVTIGEARARIFDDETALLAARADELTGKLDRFNEEYQRMSARLARAPEVRELAARAQDGELASAPAAGLAVHTDGDPAVAAAGIVDRAGRVRAATAAPLVGTHEPARRYVEQALLGTAAISGPYLSGSGVPMIAYASPILDGDRTLGVAVVWVHAEAFWQVAHRFNGLAGAGSFAVVLDRDGIRIAHTYSRDIVFRPAGALPDEAVQRLLAERRFGAATREILGDVRPFPAQFERARAERCDPGLFHGRAPVNQKISYGVGRRLSSEAWTVFYMVPRDTLTAPVTSLTVRRVIMSGIVGIAALLAGALLAALLVRPLRDLSRATARLAAGDLGARIDVDRRDELGGLGHAFNSMAAQLEDQARDVRRSRDDLELLVNRRTAELAATNRQLRDEIAVRAEAEAAVRERERALVDSERRYRELYENAPDMYLTVDFPSELITDCNRTLCDRLGYDRSELVGQHYTFVYDTATVGDEPARREAFQKAGQFVDVERTLRCKDGSTIGVSLNLHAIRDDAGTIVGARAMWRDISKRRQGERDRGFLIELGDLLRSSTDIAEVLGMVSTRLGSYLTVTRCVFAEVDAQADETTIRRDYHDGVPALQARVRSSSFGGAIDQLARGEIVVVEDTATDPLTAAAYETAYRPAALRAVISVPLMRGDLRVAGLTVASDRARVWEEREIALLKLAAERVWLWVEHLRALARLHERDLALAVAHTEERFRTLLESVRDYAIFMLDPDGNVATWNAGAERLKGYTSDEIIGRSLSVFYTPEDRASDPAQRMLDEARSRGRCEEEGWRVRKDGSRFWADSVITPVRGPDGTLDGFAKVTRDFTERRAQDEAMRAQQAALSQSLKEREVLLQEVHHRVKNNIQVISSLINMQVRKLDPGDTRSALEECQTRVLSIALIHEKLYQAKDYSHVQFSDYVRSLAAHVFHATGTSQHDVSLELAIDEVPLGVDRAIPCGLLVNELITNSLKHAFPGRRGTIRVALLGLPGRRLQLTVEDDGVGLPPGFDIHGIGSMGLQLVRTLAEQLEASLVVRGERGASFQLTFTGSRG